MRYIASVSFGKDSLAMLLLLLERKTPLDEVIFYNSGMEFQAIYNIRDRVKPILEQRGIRFTEVNPDVSFLYNMLERPINSKKNGFHLGYGWCGGPCRWGTKLKINALDGIHRNPEQHYVGIAADESERLEKLKHPKCSPLAELGMTEADCLAYCYQRGILLGGKRYPAVRYFGSGILLVLQKQKPERVESDLSVSSAVLVTAKGTAISDSNAHEAIQPKGRSLWQRV